MRKFLIAAAAATSALVAAAPAAAQYYPAPPPPYGYGNGYGYNNYGQQGLARSYINRIDQLRYRINQLDNRDRISEREARGLRNEAAYLRERVARSSYNGLSYREGRDIEVRIASLERRIGLEVRDGNKRWNPNWRDNRNYGWQDGQGGWRDRDRDGRDDRYEDDHGRRRD
jgi:hypothetical protein